MPLSNEIEMDGLLFDSQLVFSSVQQVFSPSDVSVSMPTLLLLPSQNFTHSAPTSICWEYTVTFSLFEQQRVLHIGE